jgi:hypothetical protein
MADKQERWKQLCALAAQERDPKKLMLLVQEVNRLLEEQERQKQDLAEHAAS